MGCASRCASRGHSLVERFQSPLAADGIAKEDGEKGNHVIVSEAPARKTHTLTALVQDSLLLQVEGYQSDFA